MDKFKKAFMDTQPLVEKFIDDINELAEKYDVSVCDLILQVCDALAFSVFQTIEEEET